MAVTFPLTLPTSPPPSAVRILPLSAVAVLRAPKSFRMQVQKFDGKLWGAEIDVPLLVDVEAGAWRAFATAMNGQEGTTLLGDTGAETPQGVATGTPLVNGAHAAGVDVLNIKGWSTGITNILRAGDYLQVGSGAMTRLYMNLDDASSDGGGLTALNVWPDLREALSDSDAITTQAAKGAFRFVSNERAWAVVGPGAVYDFSFTLVEAFDG